MANQMFRGELYFTAPELEAFKKRLRQLWDPNSAEDAVVNVPWQLAPLDSSATRALHLHQLGSSPVETNLPPRRERSNNKTMRKSGSRQSISTDIAEHSTIDDDIDSLFKEIMDEEDDDEDEDLSIDVDDNDVTDNNDASLETNQKAFPQLNETVEYDESMSIYPLLHPEGSLFSNMPPWIEKLHGVLVTLCKSKSGNLFITGSKSNVEKDQEEKKNEFVPQLTLQAVLENLLNNKYSSTTEAFSDIYMTLLTVFDVVEPGNTTWMSAQDACARLEGLRRDSGLVDSEISQVAGFGGKHPPATQPTQPVRQLPVNLNFVSQIQPISNTEKLQFQELLSSIAPECHLELYIAFEYSAVWRNLGNGEIELDDEATNPSVFREMMRWTTERFAKNEDEPPT